MKNGITKILSFVITAVLLASAVIYPAVLSADASEWRFEKEGYENSLDRLLTIDGFVYGMDYDWADVVSNAHRVLSKNGAWDGSATYNHLRTYTDIYNIRAFGFNSVNYWIFYALQGLKFNENGVVIGLQDGFLDNLRDILEICKECDITFIPTIQVGDILPNIANGQDAAEYWNKYFRFVWEKEAQEAYIDNALTPVLQLFAEYKDTVIAIGLTGENGGGWVNDPDIGYSVTSGTGTSWENYAGWINAMHDRVKEILPETPTECEEIGSSDRLYRMDRDTKVDLIGRNTYHSTGYVSPHTNHYITRSGFVGEYNNGESEGTDFTTYYWGQYKHRFISSAQEGGWLGAYYFSYWTGGQQFSFIKGSNSFDYETFFKWAVEFRKVIDNNRNSRFGLNPKIMPAHLLANKGTNTVYWIPPENAVRFNLERSLDGGKTFTLIGRDVTTLFGIENGLIKFIDRDLKAGDNFCYRVTSYDKDGNSAVSPVGNAADYFVATELIDNGDFEDDNTGIAGVKGWYGSGVLTSEDCFSGNGSIKLTASESSGTYSSFYQNIQVKKNTLYVLKYNYKIVTQELLDTVDLQGSYLYVSAQNDARLKNYHWGSAVRDDGWCENITTFSSGDNETLKIEVNVGAKKNFLAYFDNISVTELR